MISDQDDSLNANEGGESPICRAMTVGDVPPEPEREQIEMEGIAGGRSAPLPPSAGEYPRHTLCSAVEGFTRCEELPCRTSKMP